MMYEQLQTLEKTILDVKQQYQKACQELTRLSKQPDCNPKDINTLTAKLKNSTDEHKRTQKQLSELDTRYQNLAEAHHLMGSEQDELQKKLAALEQNNHALKQENQQLKQKNQELLEKNDDASQKIAVVLKRLTDIDQANATT